MAYEKYIKKDGKIYGPYIYHSKRVDGRVVSEYHGQGKPWKKFLWIIPAVALIILAAYFIGQKQTRTTGYSILGIDANYQEGQSLQGNLNLVLQQGEFVPANANVVFKNSGQSYEYPLVNLVPEQTTEGDFFVAGKNLSGFGAGFGISGKREIHPKVNFTLLIYSKINGTDNLESETEVARDVSADEPFVYELQDGQRAELKPRSVLVSNADRPTQLNDGDVSLTLEGNIVTVSTQYSEEEQGFGADYSGAETKNINIELNRLNLTLQPGTLDVSIVYDSQKLLSLQTTIGQSGVSGQTGIPQETTQTEQPTDNRTETAEIPIIETSLTQEEKTALENEFGNISLTAKKATLKNGFIIVRYELGNLWIEYSYDPKLDEEALSSLMEADKTKWLKDIAQSILQPEKEEREINLP